MSATVDRQVPRYPVRSIISRIDPNGDTYVRVPAFDNATDEFLVAKPDLSVGQPLCVVEDEYGQYWPTGAVGGGGQKPIYDTDQIGTIKAFYGKVIPDNWMLADGTVLNRSEYPDLADTIGIPPEQETFPLPDLRNKFIYGASDPNNQGASGGEASHLLLAGESGIPAHGHSVPGQTVVSNTENQGFNFNFNVNSGGPGWQGSAGLSVYQGSLGGANFVAITYNGAYVGGDPNKYNDFNHYHNVAGTTGTQNQNHNHNVTIGAVTAANNAATNAGTAHNNLPPYILVAFIIKVTGPTIDPGVALIGPRGLQGIQGIKGDKGDTGEIGPIGNLAPGTNIGDTLVWDGASWQPKQPLVLQRARIANSVSTVIAAGAGWVNVPLPSVVYNNGSAFTYNASTNLLTVNTSGYFDIVVRCRLDLNGIAAAYGAISATVNGGVIWSGTLQDNSYISATVYPYRTYEQTWLGHQIAANSTVGVVAQMVNAAATIQAGGYCDLQIRQVA